MVKIRLSARLSSRKNKQNPKMAFCAAISGNSSIFPNHYVILFSKILVFTQRKEKLARTSTSNLQTEKKVLRIFQIGKLVFKIQNIVPKFKLKYPEFCITIVLLSVSIYLLHQITSESPLD